ncbi:hypothetical protein JCM3770_002250 [Rhodotorula araucariae]
MDDPAAPPPDAPPPLTKAQTKRILSSPIHHRIKHYAYGSTAVAAVGATANVMAIIVSAVWARNIVQNQKWFIFHYTVASTFSLLWLVFSAVFMHHIKCLGLPGQLQIDIGWLMFAVVFAAAFLFYIFRKMQQYGVLDTFVVACSAGCTSKLDFVKLSPLVLGLTTLALGAVQLFLTVALYRNPIINPPLDAHGMPIPQDPETGRPLPLDDTGKPILPEWLRPPAGSDKGRSGAAKKGKKKDESSAGEESAEERSLLRNEADARELGREKSRRAGTERSSRRARC